MSQEDVNVVREWVSTWAGRELVAESAEPGWMDSILEGLHPELEARFEYMSRAAALEGAGAAE